MIKDRLQIIRQHGFADDEMAGSVLGIMDEIRASTGFMKGSLTVEWQIAADDSLIAILQWTTNS